MNIGETIRNARKSKGLTLEQLAHQVETDTGNLSRLERGKQGASKEMLMRIMRALDLHMAVGQVGPDSDNHVGLITGHVENVSPALQPVRKRKEYPLISWVQAGEVTESPSSLGVEAFHESTENAGDDGYWLKVSGDSMTCLGNPSFPAGSLILVRPESDLINGKYYVVEMLDSGEKTFKQYVEDAGYRYLRPLNSGYRTIEIDGNCRFLGRVVDTKMTGL